MNQKCSHAVRWSRKAAICLAFCSFLGLQKVQAFGLPPLISVPPIGITVHNGDTATMTATIGASLTPLSVIWRLNGTNIVNPKVSNITVPILGTTLSTLTIPNCSAANAGNYSVQAVNGGGSVTSGNGLLVILDSTISNILTTVSILTGGSHMTSEGFQLNLVKPATSNCVIEASTDLKNWTPICTNSVASTNVSYTDPASVGLLHRYYRARLQ